MDQSHHPVGDLVEELGQGAETGATSLRRIMEATGERSFAPLLMLPALVVVSPLSGIPFLPSLCGLSIALVALQMVLGRRHVWLPALILDRPIAAERARRAAGWLRGLAHWLDRNAKRRVSVLVSRPLIAIPQLLAALCGLAMPFLELLPFSSSILGLAVLFFATAFLTRDGIFAITGMAIMAIAASIPVYFWVQVTG